MPRCARGVLAAVLALGLLAAAAGCSDSGGGGAGTGAGTATGPDGTTLPGDGGREPASVAPPPPQRDWAPAATASIRPGVQTRTAGGQCTANFIYISGEDLLIGQAAHCSTRGGPFDIDGCETGSLPLGTEVRIDGAGRPGTMVYNSWLTMRAEDESDEDACRYNDLALVRIHPDDHDRVNPTVPVFGGPTGLNMVGVPTGEPVSSFGNSLIRLGIAALNLNQGISVAERGEGWTHEVLTLTPGIPGDSGSGFLDPRGRALGLLSTATTITSQLTDLGMALDYANARRERAVRLAWGTEPFSSAGQAPPLAEEPAATE